MTDKGEHLAAWAKGLEATIAASIYALPPQDRLRGARAAHAAGHWVHADVILRPGPSGQIVNAGVTVSEIKDCLIRIPGLRLDVHVMVCHGTQDWEDMVERIAKELDGAAVTRWSASRIFMMLLAPHLQAGSERWHEVWPERDGHPVDSSGGDGVLTMLIEPGTKGRADRAGIDVVAALAVDHTVGVDGGVTHSVALEALAAGADYLVVGRALFDHNAGTS